MHISARLFFHTFITVGDGARACEIRLQRKKGTRNVSSELVIYTLPCAEDARPLRSYADKSEPTPRSW